jgi:hypothetical protein
MDTEIGKTSPNRETRALTWSCIMKPTSALSLLMGATLLIAIPALAQTTTTPTAATPSSQKTDGESPTVVGPGSGAYKQGTDGAAPTVVGPGSAAYKQSTDGASPTIVGPGSAAYKQKTDGESPTVVGPGSGAFNKQ